MFGAFLNLDPSLQLIAVAATATFISIAGFKIWRYLQKRRSRSRSKVWAVY